MQELIDEYGKINEEIRILEEKKQLLKKKIIDQMKQRDVANYQGDNFGVSFYVKKYKKNFNIGKIVSQMDISDCYEVSMSKLRKKDDIPEDCYEVVETEIIKLVKIDDDE